MRFFKKMGQIRPLFLYLCSFQQVDLIGIRTWIVKVEGEHADDMNSSAALLILAVLLRKWANHGLFVFICVLFNKNLTEINVD